MNRLHVWLTVSIILATFGVAAGVLALKFQSRLEAFEGDSKRKAEKIAALEEQIAQAETRASVEALKAKQVVGEKSETIAALQKDVELIRGTLEGTLERLMPGLRKVQAGPNFVGQGYVESFDLANNQIRVKLTNASARAVKPQYSIHFLNRHGFATDVFTESWMLDMIAPGETRITTGQIQTTFGAPFYVSTRVK